MVGLFFVSLLVLTCFRVLRLYLFLDFRLSALVWKLENGWSCIYNLAMWLLGMFKVAV